MNFEKAKSLSIAKYEGSGVGRSCCFDCFVNYSIIYVILNSDFIHMLNLNVRINYTLGNINNYMVW